MYIKNTHMLSYIHALIENRRNKDRKKLKSTELLTILAYVLLIMVSTKTGLKVDKSSLCKTWANSPVGLNSMLL